MKISGQSIEIKAFNLRMVQNEDDETQSSNEYPLARPEEKPATSVKCDETWQALQSWFN